DVVGLEKYRRLAVVREPMPIDLVGTEHARSGLVVDREELAGSAGRVVGPAVAVFPNAELVRHETDFPDAPVLAAGAVAVVEAGELDPPAGGRGEDGLQRHVREFVRVVAAVRDRFFERPVQGYFFLRRRRGAAAVVGRAAGAAIGVATGAVAARRGGHRHGYGAGGAWRRTASAAAGGEAGERK